MTLKSLIFTLTLTVFALGAQAFQGGPGYPGDGCISPDDYECNPDNPIPLDGGASILVAAGIAYGVRKIYGNRRATKGTPLF